MKPIHTERKAPETAFAKKAEALWPCAKGSLTWVRNKCRRPGCKRCASGEGHPALLYTFRKDGRQRAMSVRPELSQSSSSPFLVDRFFGSCALTKTRLLYFMSFSEIICHLALFAQCAVDTFTAFCRVYLDFPFGRPASVFFNEFSYSTPVFSVRKTDIDRCSFENVEQT